MDSDSAKTVRHFVPNLLKGLTSYFRAFPVLFRHGLWPSQFIPAIISLVVSILMAVAFYFVAGSLSGWLDEKVTLPWEWLDSTLDYTVGILTFLLLAVGFIFLHKHLVLVLLAPFLGKIAEATYRAVNGDADSSPLSTTQSIGRSIQINFGNIFKELTVNIFFLLCSLIPIIGSLLSSSGLFLTQSRFLGYGLMDFPLEKKGLDVRQSIAFMKRRGGYATGLGAGYVLLMLIPLVGWMFAPTFGTVAGTLVAIDELNLNEKDEL